mgnify:CR=1 FL=1
MLDLGLMKLQVEQAATGLEGIDGDSLVDDALTNLYDGIAEEDVLSAVCEAVKLGTLKQWELKRTAQAFVLDEALGEGRLGAHDQIHAPRGKLQIR